MEKECTVKEVKKRSGKDLETDLEAKINQDLVEIVKKNRRMLLGDRIEQITTATGIKTVVEGVSKITKKPCGCAKRKEALNNPNLLINKILK